VGAEKGKVGISRHRRASQFSVSHGLKTTFRLLTETQNEAAVSVLIPALDSPVPAIQEGAFHALLKRRSPAGQREILGRLQSMDERWKEILGKSRGKLSIALRDAVLGTDAQLFANACQAVVWFREYDLIAAFLNVAEDRTNPHAERAAGTVLELVQALYQELSSPRDYRERRDPQMVRRHVITSLEGSVVRFPQHQCKRIVEAFLVLAKRDNAVLRKILQDPHAGSYRPVIDGLTKSSQPGLMRLLLSFLDDPRVPSAAISIFTHRSDARFIQQFLAFLAESTSDAASQNLKRIEHLAWLRNDREFLESLDDTAQASLVHLVMASGMKRLAAFETVSAVVRYGNDAGRRAACAALADFNGAEANKLIEAALQDVDPQVQVSALVELRQRGIPNAMARLIEMVASPHRAVREAARSQLGEFKLECYLAAFESLDDEVRRTTGALVVKVDPEAISGLVQEMEAPARSRRLRALAAAEAMNVAAQLEPSLLALIEDEDHMVRAEAACTLASCKTPTAQRALQLALGDRSVSVQAAAQQGLIQLNGLPDSTPPPTGVVT